MPTREFQAIGEDHRLVLRHVFDTGDCRVFEKDSPDDQELMEFQSLADVEARYGITDWSEPKRNWPKFVLHPHDAGGKLLIERRELRNRRKEVTGFCYECLGWGLVHLALEDGQQRRSITNHNSPKRAAGLDYFYTKLGPAADWNWPAVAAFSRRLIRFIDKSSVAKQGSKRLLPAAAAYWASRPTTPHNPPMQWTGPAGKLLAIREPARRRLGH